MRSLSSFLRQLTLLCAKLLGKGKLFSDWLLFLQQDSLKGGGKWSNGAEMTEEEALAEQQRMFAEARARMNGGAIASKQPEADQSLDS